MSFSLFYPFNLTLTVMAPVHIGSGERISSMEFQIKKEGSQTLLSVFSLDALLRWIAGRPDAERLASLLTTMLENPKNGGLRKFIADYKVPLSLVENYAIPLAEGVRANEVREVLTFIKTTGNNVYLPGSSLKGSIRSALLRGTLIQEKNLQERAERLVLKGIAANHTNSSAIEAEVFVKPQVEKKKWSNYDLNRLISIRDSALFEAHETLRLYAVRMLSVSNRNTLHWKLNPTGGSITTLFVEMLPAGFSVKLPVIWQGYLLSELAGDLHMPEQEVVFVFWNTYLRQVSLNLLRQEHDFYRRHPRSELAQWYEKRLIQMEKADPNVCILPLGWGSGYDAKTVTDLFSEKTFVEVVKASGNLSAFRNVKGLGKPGNNPAGTWLGMADSPKSRKVIYKNETEALPVGWVAICLEPADEDAKAWIDAERRRLGRYQPAVPRPARADKQVQPAEVPLVEEDSPKPAPLPSSPKAALQPIAAAVQIIARFTAVPKVGDVFEGTYVDEDAGEVLYEIPGLDFETQAYAVVRRSEYPAFPKKLARCRLTVKQILPEVKNYYKVICDPEWEVKQ